MKTFLIILSLISLTFIACKEPKLSNLNRAQICDSLPDEFGKNKIANGCSMSNRNIYGNNSTVFLNMGCTGTVVSNHFVITAAHCLYNQETKRFINPSSINIVYGDNSFDVFNIKITNVKKYYTNPYFTNNINDYDGLGDIALIETDKDLVKDLNLTPAKIAVNKPKNTDLLLSIGYGNTGKYNSKSIGLKRWTVSSVGKPDPMDRAYGENYTIIELNSYFESQVNQKNVSKKYDTSSPVDTLIITEKVSSQQGQTCYGDSGGPQFIVRNGEALLISATQGSTAVWLGKKAEIFYYNKEDDCNKLSTSISTRIAPYVLWLNAVMQPKGEQLQLVEN